MPSAPGVSGGGQIVGELDVRVEPNPDAVGRRRRTPALGVDGRRRTMILGVVRGAGQLLVGRIENHVLAVPSMITSCPACTRALASCSPTTAGTSSERARIAV